MLSFCLDYTCKVLSKPCLRSLPSWSALLSRHSLVLVRNSSGMPPVGQRTCQFLLMHKGSEGQCPMVDSWECVNMNACQFRRDVVECGISANCEIGVCVVEWPPAHPPSLDLPLGPHPLPNTAPPAYGAETWLPSAQMSSQPQRSVTEAKGHRQM